MSGNLLVDEARSGETEPMRVKSSVSASCPFSGPPLPGNGLGDGQIDTDPLRQFPASRTSFRISPIENPLSKRSDMIHFGK
jgi:hypothetical protein